MTSADHAAFVAMGRAMAARNGYTPMQSSDLYITDGDQIDWLYGNQRIFSFTWELYPPETSTVWGDHYPADETIATQTARNKEALLYIIGAASCPLAATGRASIYCGPLYDDMEIARGWTVNPDGTDTATRGAFRRGDPAPTTSAGLVMQSTTTASGRAAFVTGLPSGSSANSDDLDGTTTLRSRRITIPGDVTGRRILFRYTFAHGPGSKADYLRVYLEDDQGARRQVWTTYGSSSTVGAKWKSGSIAITNPEERTIRIVFQAVDGGSNSLVEMAVDDVLITRDCAC
jgi:hypothetical protein